MDNKEITERLELVLGCMIGSHTNNATPEHQIENLITDLKAKNNEVLDLVSESWYNKLKSLMEGLEIENIDLLLATGKDGDYRRLGDLMQKRIKELL